MTTAGTATPSASYWTAPPSPPSAGSPSPPSWISETVYVEDTATGRVRIFTPASELPLAGHPLVGTGWLLHQQGHPVTELNPPAGPVATWTEDEFTWIRGPVAAAPEWTLNHVADAATVAAMTAVPSPEQDADQFWAW